MTQGEENLQRLYDMLELKIIKNNYYFYKHPKDGNIYKLRAANSFKRENRGATFLVESHSHHGYIHKSLITLKSFIKLNSLECLETEISLDKLLIKVLCAIISKNITVVGFSKRDTLFSELSSLLCTHPDEYYLRLTEIETNPKYEPIRKLTTELI